MSKEHLFSEWMGELFGEGKKNTFFRYSYTEKYFNKWESQKLDVTAKVVCENCNNNWMSDIETKLAKPALSPMILSNERREITPDIARSIAIFAFKTTAVLYFNNMKQFNKLPIPNQLSDRKLTDFRNSLKVPNGIRIWVGEFRDQRQGTLQFADGQTKPGISNGYRHTSLFFAVGKFFFQILLGEWKTPRRNVPRFKQSDNWEPYSTEIWPPTENKIIWPPAKFLHETDDNWVIVYSHRWAKIAADTFNGITHNHEFGGLQ
jgi:hypothetical protein